MKMFKTRYLFFQSILFLSITSYAQKPNFSQIALDFFTDSILKNNEIIYVQKKLDNPEIALFDSSCLKNLERNKKLKINQKNKSLSETDVKNINFTNVAKYPLVSLSMPLSNKKNQNFVVIDYRPYLSSGIYYLLEIDDNGLIQDKCELKYIE